MKRVTRAQQKKIVQQWENATPALARARDEEIASWSYAPETVNALLEIGARCPQDDVESSGLVQMQRLFMKAARRQGLLPKVSEDSAAVDPTGTPTKSKRNTD